MLVPVVQFVVEHFKEHSISIVKRGFSISFVGHTSHIECFDTHNIIPIGYLGRFLVQIVKSLICNMPMDFSNFGELLQVIIGLCFSFSGACFTRQLPLGFCKFLLAFTIVFMVTPNIAITVNEQTVRSIVKTNRICGIGFLAPKLKKCPDILLYQGKTINFYNYVFEWRAQLEPVGILRLRSPP